MNPNLKDFNSIKVRLERSEDVELPFASPFQFHKGTIRTKYYIYKWGYDTYISIP